MSRALFARSTAQIFTGKMGDGKTYMAVEFAAKYLAVGGNVVSNIAFNVEACADYCTRFGWKMNPKQIMQITDTEVLHYWEHAPPGRSRDWPTLVIIDEADNELNSYTKSQNKHEKCALFQAVKHARKDFYHLVFIVQHADNLDKQVVNLVQYIWRIRNEYMRPVPLLGFRYPLKQFYRCQVDVTCPKEYVSKGRYYYDTKIFGLYDTRQMHQQFNTKQAFADFGEALPDEDMKTKALVYISLSLNVFTLAFLLFRGSAASPAPDSVVVDSSVSPPAVVAQNPVVESSGVVPAVSVSPPVPRPASGIWVEDPLRGRVLKQSVGLYRDYGFYHDLEGAGVALLDGNSVRVGDRIPFGLVRSIDQRRIICESENEFTAIVHWIAPVSEIRNDSERRARRVDSPYSPVPVGIIGGK